LQKTPATRRGSALLRHHRVMDGDLDDLIEAFLKQAGSS
jgi:hypothetical protein